MTFPCIKCKIHKYTITQIRKYTNTKCLKDPTCAIFLKSMGFKDIKYDIPVCQIHYIYRTFTGHLQDIYRTFTGHLQDIYRTFTGHLKDIYRTFKGHLKDIYRTFTGYLQDIYRTFKGYLQDI